jgi:hypothetical protein
MNGKINSLEELTNQLNMISELRGDFITNGNDNLEVFGISNAASIGVLNNHSDFGILKEAVSAGVTQIKMINASGYRFVERQPVSTMATSTVNLNHRIRSFVSEITGNLILINNQYAHSITPDFTINRYLSGNTNYKCFSEKFGLISTTGGTTAHRNIYIYNESGVNIGYTGSPDTYSGYSMLYDNYLNKFYLYAMDSSNNFVLWRSAVVTNNTSKIAFTNGGSVSSRPGLQLYSSKYSSYIVTNNDGFEIYDNTQTEPITKSAHAIAYRLCYNGSVFLSLEAETTTSDGVIYRYSESGKGKLNISDGGTVVNIPFLNGRRILDLVEKNGIFYITGKGNLFGYSLDGINFIEILSDDVVEQTMDYAQVGVMNDGSAFIGSGVPSTANGISKYEPFNPESFKYKRYKLGSEFVTISNVELSGADIIATLTEPLKSSHSANEPIQRTTDSNIQPNSTQTVCIDLQNVYPHNAAAAKPIFTNIENVSVVAEVCQRNENDIEQWVSFPLMKEDDLKNGWVKNTYYKVFPQSKSVWAIAFTVTNNNETPIELNQLGIGLSNEVYEE